MLAYTIIKSPLQPLPLDTALRRVHQLSTLPQVAIKIVQMVHDPALGGGDLARAVESDPALCARLLRCVNSAAYGLRFKITTVHRAVVYLGFDAVRNLALTAAVSRIFQKPLRLKGYNRLRLWQHMVSVAVCARMTARRAGLAQFEEAFLAGLLHDVGLILEDQYLHSHFVAVIESLGHNRSLLEMEQKVLGFDHTLYGELVAETWKFPESVVAAVRHHHTPQNYTGPHQQIVACVALAEFLCSVRGRPEVHGTPLVPCPHAFAVLQLDAEGLKVLCADLDREFAGHAALFDLHAAHD
jgi:putative nucleotidyltransferase with HDIG domain